MKVIDTAGMTEDQIKEQEGKDDVTIEENKKDNDPEFGKGGEPDPDKGGEGGKAPKGGEEDQGGAGGDEGDQGDEGNQGTKEISQEDFKASILNDIKELIPSLIPKPETKLPPAEMTDEEKQAESDKLGLPWATIEFLKNQNAQVLEQVQDIIDGRLSKSDQDSALNKLAQDPKFSDAIKHKDDVSEFLKNFDDKHHKDQKVLKLAVTWARGKNMESSIKKVRTSGDRNLRIAGVNRPASPGAGNRSPAPKPLTDIERQAMKAGGFKSEQDYRNLKGGKVFDT